LDYEKKINVLSLFDGMSCGQIALERAGIKVDNYFASEVKKHAIKVTQNNYPNTKQIGDVKKVKSINLPKIDLLIGGSPCQDFSIARTGLKGKIGERLGVEGKKSSLFNEYVRLFKESKPKYFLLENVKMKKEHENYISNIMGVKPILINSIDFSFQKRTRLYWTNIPINKYEPKNINFQDFKSTNYEYCKKFKVNKTPSRIKMWEEKCPNVTNSKHVNCLTVKQDRWNNSGLIEFEDFCRYLTTEELEAAQTVPIGYTSSVSKNQSENLLGDGWTVDVIAHIFKNINK